MVTVDAFRGTLPPPTLFFFFLLLPVLDGGRGPPPFGEGVKIAEERKAVSAHAVRARWSRFFFFFPFSLFPSRPGAAGKDLLFR